MTDYISFDIEGFKSDISVLAEKVLKECQELLYKQIMNYPFIDEDSGTFGVSGEYKRSLRILEITNRIAEAQIISGVVSVGGSTAWWAYFVEEGTGGKEPRAGPWTAPGKLPDRGSMPNGKPWPLGPPWEGGRNFMQFPGKNGGVVRRWTAGPNPAQHLMANALQMSVSPIARVIAGYFKKELPIILNKRLKVAP